MVGGVYCIQRRFNDVWKFYFGLPRKVRKPTLVKIEWTMVGYWCVAHPLQLEGPHAIQETKTSSSIMSLCRTLATAHDCTCLQAIGRISLTNVVGMWAGRKIPTGFHNRFLTTSFKPFLYFCWGWLARCSLNGGAYALMWKFLKCLEGQKECWDSHQFLAMFRGWWW